MSSSDPVIRVNIAATTLFAATTVLATVMFDEPFTTVSVAVDLACFSVGVVVFLWGYWTAVQRSRREEISVAGMYFLVGNCAPRSVSRRLNSMLAIQVVVGIGGALARPTTDGKAGSTLAFGILVPMLGLGLNGLWASKYGTFRPRNTPDTSGVTRSGASTGQDESHD